MSFGKTLLDVYRVPTCAILGDFRGLWHFKRTVVQCTTFVLQYAKQPF